MTNLMTTSMASLNLLALLFLLPSPKTLCTRFPASDIHEQSDSQLMSTYVSYDLFEPNQDLPIHTLPEQWSPNKKKSPHTIRSMFLISSPLHMPTNKTTLFQYLVLAKMSGGRKALGARHYLITIINKVFEDEDPGKALESVVDGNLKRNYPMEDAYKMAEIAEWCLSEDPINRPEMGDVVVELSQTMISSIEWEASLGLNSQVFSGVFNGH